jgi:hypothetical protein
MVSHSPCKGGFIDEINKIIHVRGHFIRDVVADKHRPFWRAFLAGSSLRSRFQAAL